MATGGGGYHSTSGYQHTMNHQNNHQQETSGSGHEASRETMGDDNGSTGDSSEFSRPIGLTGLQNLGNTCYMNAGLQALSNCPQLTGFMLDCGPYVRKPGLAKAFLRLINEMWSNRRPSYVVPAGISQGIKKIYPSFKGYAQHDAQEFLRCLLDQLHEELKEPIITNRNGACCSCDESSSCNYSANHSQSCHNCHESCCGASCIPISPGTLNNRIRHHSASTADTLINGHHTHNSHHNHPHHHNHNNRNSNYSKIYRDSDDDGLSSDDSKDYETCDSGLSVDKACTPGAVSLMNSDNISCNGSNGHNHNDSQADVVMMSDGLNDDQSIDSSGVFMSHTETLQEPLLGARDKLQHNELHNHRVSSTTGNNNSSSAAKKSKYSHGGSGGGSSASSTCSNSDHHKTETSSGSSSNISYRSIISDVFDGKLLSSVQCLTCDNISTTKETFQDLSLSIPTRDQLNSMRSRSTSNSPSAAGSSSSSLINNSSGGLGIITQNPPAESGRSSPMSQSIHSNQSGSTSGQLNNTSNIIWQWIEWFFGWLWGPTITLEDCLSAFFSADELKGDNMYSCEKCKKLRNGIKYSRVYHLPDILCIHLKRFRHELMYSSKISSQVTFPMEGLDLAPYMVPSNTSSVTNPNGSSPSPLSNCDSPPPDAITTYDLVAVICHHGTPASGHYTSYCLNSYSDTWYEFDDQYVTAVDPHQVASCEAYVLFYRKTNDEVYERRHRAVQLIERCSSELGSSGNHQVSSSSLNDVTSSKEYYVSNQWINRFNTFADPGPISNSDFLCEHGMVPPAKISYVKDLCTVFSQEIWEYLLSKYGGGPLCNQLVLCRKCSMKIAASAMNFTDHLSVSQHQLLLSSCSLSPVTTAPSILSASPPSGHQSPLATHRSHHNNSQHHHHSSHQGSLNSGQIINNSHNNFVETKSHNIYTSASHLNNHNHHDDINDYYNNHKIQHDNTRNNIHVNHNNHSIQLSQEELNSYYHHLNHPNLHQHHHQQQQNCQHPQAIVSDTKVGCSTLSLPVSTSLASGLDGISVPGVVDHSTLSSSIGSDRSGSKHDGNFRNLTKTCGDQEERRSERINQFMNPFSNCHKDIGVQQQQLIELNGFDAIPANDLADVKMDVVNSSEHHVMTANMIDDQNEDDDDQDGPDVCLLQKSRQQHATQQPVPVLFRKD